MTDPQTTERTEPFVSITSRECPGGHGFQLRCCPVCDDGFPTLNAWRASIGAPLYPPEKGDR